MATAILTPDLPQGLPYQPMRVSVERYHDMIARGFFAENERFELLNGVIVEKMTKNPPHASVTRKCVQLLTRLVPPSWSVFSQDPITLTTSEPEPDVTIVKGEAEDFVTRHPRAEDILLVIEVADCSLVTDRFKAGIYAAAQIGHYWIVNIPERVIEVYSAPKLQGEGASYGERKVFQGDAEVPVEIEGKVVGQVRVSELLP